MTANWSLVASHGAVLFYLGAHHEPTLREVAARVDLSERRVSQIIRDLAEQELLAVERRGRRNVYHVNTQAPFLNPLRDVRIGDVVKLILDSEPLAKTA